VANNSLLFTSSIFIFRVAHSNNYYNTCTFPPYCCHVPRCSSLFILL
jgi:hypothetical protein